MDTLIDSETLKIAFQSGDGTSRAAVLAFAGVASAFDGMAAEEFARSLNAAGGGHDTYFIIDKQRLWYNTTAQDILAELVPRLAGQRVVTLGNSMGGFGALLFGGLVPGCAASIAFCPQYSIDRTVAGFETRWAGYIDAIDTVRYSTCLLPGSGRRFVFFGADEPADRPHADLIRTRLTPGDGLFTITGCGHGVARYLKARQALAPLLATCLQSGADSATASACLDAHGIGHTLWQPASA